MINFDDYANENRTEHKRNWPYISDHPYRILIIGGSGSGKTNEFNRKPTRHWLKYVCMLKIYIKQNINI